jgi:hypothetical protein
MGSAQSSSVPGVTIACLVLVMAAVTLGVGATAMGRGSVLLSTCIGGWLFVEAVLIVRLVLFERSISATAAAAATPPAGLTASACPPYWTWDSGAAVCANRFQPASGGTYSSFSDATAQTFDLLGWNAQPLATQCATIAADNIHWPEVQESCAAAGAAVAAPVTVVSAGSG